MSSKDWKKYRKQLLISPRFQHSFMRYVVGIALGTTLIFYAAKLVFFYQVQRHLHSLGFPPSHVLYDFTRHQSRVMDAIFATAALVECIFLAWMGLKLSHRVAGPLHRLRQELLRTAQGGEVTKLKFRDGDYFEELADAYNEHMKTIAKRSNAA